jgi:hypothetical protein
MFRVTKGLLASVALKTMALRDAPQTTGQPKYRSCALV